MSDFALLTRRLTYLTEAQGKGFVEMSREVGLDPRRDFRGADLSGVDLRGQDLRGYDFTRAKMAGARIHGATFRPRLSKWQIRSADSKGRAACLFVGPMLETALDPLRQALEPAVLTPLAPNQALQRVGREREQHYGAGGTFLSDGRVAISRILSRPLRETEVVLRQASTAVLFFQPSTDFDFDTLAVLDQKLRRINRRHVTFVFPAFMEGDTGRRLFEVREKTAFLSPADTVVFQRAGGAKDIHEAQAANSRYLQHVVDWLALLDRARFVLRAPPLKVRADQSEPQFVSGVVRARGSMVSALRDQIGPQPTSGFIASPQRRHLYVSQTAAGTMDLKAVAAFLGTSVRPVSISVFPDAVGIVDRYYLITAGEHSAVWSLTQ
jgi:hypothetical protein